jgi:hypothetical protein
LFLGSRRSGARIIVYALALAVLLAGCSGSKAPSPTPSASSAAEAMDPVLALQGRVYLGPADGAKVSAYPLRSDGSRGPVLAQTSADATGRFTLGFSEMPRSPLVVEAVGGKYFANGTWNPMPAGAGLSAAWRPESSNWVSITAFTHMAAQRATTLSKAGAPLELAVASSNAGIANQYLLVDPVGVDPAPRLDDPAAFRSLDELAYEVLTGGFLAAASLLHTDPFTLAQALGRDASDGLLDGKYGAGDVTLSLQQDGAAGAAPMYASAWDAQAAPAPKLEPTAGRQFLVNGIQVFRQTPGYQSTPAFDIVVDPIPIGVNNQRSLYGGTAVLPAWIAGQRSSQTLTAQGGTPPYGCVAATPLPTGFGLAGCTLNGQPPLLPSGTSMLLTPPFRIQITDSAAPPATQVLTLQVTILNREPVIATAASVCPIGADGYAQADQCAPQRVASVPAAGPTDRYYYRHDSLRWGFPPFGMSVWTDGLLHGKTRQAGVYVFRVCAIDMVGANDCGDVSVTILKPTPTPTPNSTEAADEPREGKYEGPFQGSLGTHADPYGCEWRITFSGRMVVDAAQPGPSAFGTAKLNTNVQWTLVSNGEAGLCTSFSEAATAEGPLTRSDEGFVGTMTGPADWYCLDLQIEGEASGAGYDATVHGTACVWTQDDQSDKESKAVTFSVRLDGP